MNTKRKCLLCLAILLLFLTLHSRTASAEGRWYVFREEDVPAFLGYRVSDYTGEVTLTFLGDCTLGGEKKSQSNARSFFQVIRREGFRYPVRDLVTLTQEDDVTLANLEGVLTDRELEKVKKTYNFLGPTEYTQILTLGGIECVSLANNHSMDYGQEGYDDTCTALAAASVSYVSEDTMAVWESPEGVLIGFTGVAFELSGKSLAGYQKRMQLLQDVGCSAVITVMHAGVEYETHPSQNQKQIARYAARAGACLVVGHHPHVVQGWDTVEGMPVVYSLGNCIFGGNYHPKDMDALVLQAKLRFAHSELAQVNLFAHPVSISSVSGANNYSPVFLKDADAQRVLDKMEASTGKKTGVFDENLGAPIPWQQTENE